MKKILFLLLGIVLLASCQKKDDNGDLGGNWKLLQIEDFENDTIINTKEYDRFWAIQLDLMQVTQVGLGRFQHIGDSLFVQMIYVTDKPISRFKDVGMYTPENERYGVVHLDRKRMILRSKYAELDFRKF